VPAGAGCRVPGRPGEPALVYHHVSSSFGEGQRARLDVVNERRRVARYPAYLEDNARFEASEAAHEAARAVRAQLGSEQESLVTRRTLVRREPLMT
jgi:hypothetical protein